MSWMSMLAFLEASEASEAASRAEMQAESLREEMSNERRSEEDRRIKKYINDLYVNLYNGKDPDLTYIKEIKNKLFSLPRRSGLKGRPYYEGYPYKALLLFMVLTILMYIFMFQRVAHSAPIIYAILLIAIFFTGLNLLDQMKSIMAWRNTARKRAELDKEYMDSVFHSASILTKLLPWSGEQYAAYNILRPIVEETYHYFSNKENNAISLVTLNKLHEILLGTTTINDKHVLEQVIKESSNMTIELIITINQIRQKNQ